MYYKRELEDKIKAYLDKPEIIAVLGPRQVGKTTLLKKIYEESKDAVFLTFEDIELKLLFEEDIKSFVKLYIEPYKTIFIDEFQYVKEGGKKLKYIYDTSTGKKLLISGSSAINLSIEAIKYLAGRIFVFYLYSFSFSEFLSAADKPLHNIFIEEDKFSEQINKKIYKYLLSYLVYGGYPRILLAKDDEEKKEVLKNIVNIYLLRDIKDLISIADETRYYKLLKALALQIGNITVYNELAAVSGLDYYKTKRILSIFEKLFLVKFVTPYFSNKRIEISKNPKVFFMDLGIRNAILGDFKLIDDRVDKGALFENYIFRAFYENDKSVKYYRSKSGTEIDFIIDDKLPVEVKSKLSKPSVSKSFRSFIQKYNTDKGIILNSNTTGSLLIDKCNVLFLRHYMAEKPELY